MPLWWKGNNIKLRNNWLVLFRPRESDRKFLKHAFSIVYIHHFLDYLEVKIFKNNGAFLTTVRQFWTSVLGPKVPKLLDDRIHSNFLVCWLTLSNTLWLLILVLFEGYSKLSTFTNISDSETKIEEAIELLAEIY